MLDIIKNNLDKLNKLESKTILKLIQEVYVVLQENYDHNHIEYLCGLEVFTNRENLEF